MSTWHRSRHLRWLLGGWLALVIVLTLAACQSGSQTPSGGSGVNHVAASAHPQYVRVTFSASTSYDQARNLLTSVGQVPYPWSCTESFLLTPAAGQLSVRPVTTPPPSPEQDTPAMFAASHQFMVAYPTQQQIRQLAASDQVTSVDVANLPVCTPL